MKGGIKGGKECGMGEIVSRHHPKGLKEGEPILSRKGETRFERGRHPDPLIDFQMRGTGRPLKQKRTERPQKRER
jgi:hypothetical protein